MRKIGGGLFPDGDAAAADFEAVRSNKSVVVTIKQARNPDHLKKYWAIASAVARFDPDFADAEDADFWVRSHIPGMRESFTMKDGRVSIRVRSIAVESMDQIAFNNFFDRALHLWAEKIGTDPETLAKEARGT